MQANEAPGKNSGGNVDSSGPFDERGSSAKRERISMAEEYVHLHIYMMGIHHRPRKLAWPDSTQGEIWGEGEGRDGGKC